MRGGLDGEELRLVGLDGVEESVEVGGVGGRELGLKEVEAAHGVQCGSVDGVS